MSQRGQLKRCGSSSRGATGSIGIAKQSPSCNVPSLSRTLPITPRARSQQPTSHARRCCRSPASLSQACSSTAVVVRPQFRSPSGSGDRCVFSNVRSAILSAHSDDVRQPSVRRPRPTLHQAACGQRLSSKRRDGQENRRLVAYSFRSQNRPIEKSGDCAQECAQMCVP
jgi:hypothetical protein